MDIFKQLETFVTVVNSGGLSAAARKEGVVPAMVGRRLDALEDRLGVKLLLRTTRSMSLTQEGAIYYEDAQRILRELQEADSAVAIGNAQVSGHLHVIAPPGFGRRHVAPHFGDFQREHPDLHISLDLSDRVVDLAKERIDCAIRVSELEDSSMVAMRLTEISRVVVAAPSYLARRGTPETPSDLARHECMPLMGDSQVRGWLFNVNGASTHVKVRGGLESTDGMVLRDWALQGLGIAWRPMWEVRDDIAQGRLIRLLESYTISNDPVYAVVAHRKFMPSRVRLFIDYLRSVYARKDYWG
ncbi:MAG: LysR family transcriptional regulator [Oxalobacter sp.]|nr:MAG: LysR family transcriptional regulator [Oxalobacter sp.]